MINEIKASGLLCHRANTTPIEDVFVYGERSTGTNVTKFVLQEVFGLKVNKSYGWKHGYPGFLAASKRTLFVVSLRDAMDWCVSMYAKPYHATKEIRQLGFDEFIRSPWLSEMDAPLAHGLKRGLHFRQPMQWDRHPISGQPYRTIFDMRTIKTRSWLGLLERGVNVAILRHEVFRDDTARCVDKLADVYGLSQRGPVQEPEYLLEKQAGVEERRAKAKAGLSENRHYIISQLDRALETEIGYSYGA